MKYPNIYALFRERVAEGRGREAFFVRKGGRWEGISWERFGDEAQAFACALSALGLKVGSKVCILMGNVPEWPVSDLGTIIMGGVSVGLYPTSSAEQCQYIINHSDAELVLVDTGAQLDKILRVRHQLPKLRTIVALDEAAARERVDVLSYRELLRLGQQRCEEFLPSVLERAASARPEEIAIMVYTSGTTALPKGACLSHLYILKSVESLRETIPIYADDVSFSYLPYCHVAERISGLYNRLYAGAPAYFVEDLTKLWDYMTEVRPTVFASLPRFFEKMHARIMSDLERDSPAEKKRFDEVLRLGRELSRRRQARGRIPEQLQREYLDQSGPVLSRIRDYFGGRLRLATSGGAPLPQEIAEFFDALSLPILQAYGLTENLCVAFNRPDNYKFGTVGPAMPGCRVRIADDGEILVRSEMMFSGYYKEPLKTAEMFRDGWLLTGDLGEMDDEGFLKITGRKKELIVTSSGKNIAPALIENLLKEHHLISQAMAYGDGKSYLVALITLNQAEAEAYARSQGIAYSDFADLTRQPLMSAKVRQMVEGVNRRVSSTEAIKRFAILDHDFSVEADEITPTMKLKRNVLSERYREVLEQLYSEQTGSHD